ncbi:hypothetical protein SAMN05216480_101602 [Pustulibacterium marinum]|uniref:Glycoamylase-like domain-containing protein n=1 Tax=Pustulibacterium marinum TaxID=1224947 RepID=A0A1I7F3R2_9FLAO|nr:glucoamylase family protein [Pustulibacterium marinum]SFU30807.1 hypothetical protein SAMN05216480_101602 [Pustulibacterium marinum]
MKYTKVVAFCFIFIFLIGCKKSKKAEETLLSPKEVSENTKAPIINNQLLDTLQYQTFNYFWEGAEPNSGLARERIHMDGVYPQNDANTVTTGGSGFGVMAIIVGVERGFITREQAVERFETILNFLETADRFHGAWPHWMIGETGKVKPFSKKDNGGDLVETAFLIEGLLTVSEYFKDGSEREQKISDRIEKMYDEVEWDWYTQGKNVLYWHWSPEYKWEMNFPVGGYNECLVMYVLAASSRTHAIDPKVYHEGWARGGDIAKDTTYYGLKTELDYFEHSDAPIGPLFWAHYSYTGLSPKGLEDTYADYWKLVQNQALIHYKYALDNPKNFKGYGKQQWGFTSSYSINGYHGHRPGDDLGVISPTAALSSMAYTPEESMQMIEYLYKDADSLVGKYGPYDAYSDEFDWYTPRYLAIDQGPIPVMIENYRSGIFWDLFMKRDDVQNGLKRLGFKSTYFN